MTSETETERLYRAGAARWQARDLEGAVELLAEALAASPGPDDDPWWFSTTRALAQIALERDDPDTAAVHLARSPADLVSSAQTHALRARLALLRGDEATARSALGHAVVLVQHDRTREIGPLMNGAIALASCAEVLVELGYGEEAQRALTMADDRITRAGIHDPVVRGWLALSSAGAARLQGDLDLAGAELAAVDVAAGDDFPVRAAREAARMAWDEGRPDEARAGYDRAIAAAEDARHPALVRLLREERASGPPASRRSPLPVDRWAELPMGGADLPDPEPEEVLLYALVLTVPVDGDSTLVDRLDHAVTALLEDRPELGEVDGVGTDGLIWELYADGDEPEALWDAVRPLCEAAPLPRGSQATIRHLDGSWRIEPLAPPR